MTKWVYGFGGGRADGAAAMKALLGGKGANLAEMSNLGLPVPPGFTISTEVCTWFYAHDRTYPDELTAQVDAALAAGRAGARHAASAIPSDPLLVSVRSGAPVSMPGMMDTVLNLGLNDRTVAGPGRGQRRPRASPSTAIAASSRCTATWCWRSTTTSSRRRSRTLKRGARRALRHRPRRATPGASWSRSYKKHRRARRPASRSRRTRSEQLWGAIGAVFGSWMTARAITYRRLHNIPDDMGTAVNVQAMVFGNMGDDCATGVAFTRNPSTGENAPSTASS